ncbi:MAG: hypothetical protein WDN72_01940 [Alphaproteobacteria bacterium]
MPWPAKKIDPVRPLTWMRPDVDTTPIAEYAFVNPDTNSAVSAVLITHIKQGPLPFLQIALVGPHHEMGQLPGGVSAMPSRMHPEVIDEFGHRHVKQDGFSNVVLWARGSSREIQEALDDEGAGLMEAFATTGLLSAEEGHRKAMTEGIAQTLSAIGFRMKSRSM